MDHVGIDLHKRESQICIEAELGEVIEKRIRTVALARKLAGILYAMWRDGSTFEKREGRAVREVATA